MMGHGSKEICGRLEVEEDTDVAEDDGIKHDVFVSAASVGDVGNGEVDSICERWCCTGAER